MIVEDLERILDQFAPRALAEPWDNVGLLVGRRGTQVSKVLVALDLTQDVVVEAVMNDYQAIVTHHPLIFSPVRRVTDRDRVGVLITQLIAADVALFAAHTNLDGAPGGLCELVANELGVAHLRPLTRAPMNARKFVGFVPSDAVEAVSRALFAAGAGSIGDYEDCAFGGPGEGSFTPRPGADPTVGRTGEHERVSEIRWETLVPDDRVAAVVQAYISAHPYEEPAFDVYPVDNVRTAGGQGRVGSLRSETSLVALAETAAEVFELPKVCFVGDRDKPVDRVAVVTGSGASLMEIAAGAADVLITGDLKYHDAERASDLGLALVSVPHEHLETWAMRRWTERLARTLGEKGADAVFSTEARSLWHTACAVSHEREPNGVASLFDIEEAGRELPRPGTSETRGPEDARVYVLRTDGASRGNPGPSSIGVVLEDDQGNVLEENGARIGTATNNQAEYQALITGLETALDRSVTRLRILSDSELLVKQLRQEYKVKNEQLKELYLLARSLIQRFERVEIAHVAREENSRADELANLALDGKI
jgi:dinuclear metal center YbgI/SA1388 family protein